MLWGHIYRITEVLLYLDIVLFIRKYFTLYRMPYSHVCHYLKRLLTTQVTAD